jgi:hypothetical protein
VAFQPRAAQQIELEPLARDHLRFESLRGPGKRHRRVRAPRQQLARDGDARIQMPAGATAGDDDAAG